MKNVEVVSHVRSSAGCARVPALLLAVTSRRNGAFVIEAKPDFKLAAQNKLAGDDSDFNATPAIAGRQLFLRSNRTLYCIESVQKAGAGKTQ